ncbi:unnamed protein product [Allacma fusca]|uniref:Uncharacterized protein n=1 Tax=Allacma fusca TaxID=39272 RepID=A0A8J2PPY9_9HEXA|nr:unnamed protein product [Allacma fusca]
MKLLLNKILSQQWLVPSEEKVILGHKLVGKVLGQCFSENKPSTLALKLFQIPSKLIYGIVLVTLVQSGLLSLLKAFLRSVGKNSIRLGIFKSTEYLSCISGKVLGQCFSENKPSTLALKLFQIPSKLIYGIVLVTLVQSGLLSLLKAFLRECWASFSRRIAQIVPTAKSKLGLESCLLIQFQDGWYDKSDDTCFK